MRGWGLAICLGAVLTAAACRQPDGLPPEPLGEQPNKIEDIGRDLQNVAGKATDAELELAQDLQGLDERTRQDEDVRALAAALAGALADRSFSDAQAQELARQLFNAAAARDLSSRQIDQLGGELTRTVTELGADLSAAERVGTTAVTLAKAVTENRPRWYHLF